MVAIPLKQMLPYDLCQKEGRLWKIKARLPYDVFTIPSQGWSKAHARRDHHVFSALVLKAASPPIWV